ncbi:metal ABC transporter solute-binding protein, Zn/Mn family [Ferdinandcohnia sp. Marseille-Q9671]
MKKAMTGILTVLFLSIFMYGCQSKESSGEVINQDKTKLKVYTTIFPIYDFTKKIGGEHVLVESIYPPNVDAHTFEPTTRMMIQIAEADAFIYNGAGIEGFVDAAVEVLEKENVKLIEASKGIPMRSSENTQAHEEEHAHENEHVHEEEHAHEEEQAHEDEHAQEEEHAHENEQDHTHSHGDTDPHIWLDPLRAITMAENIKDTLSELKPEAKEEFEQNFLEVKEELEILDEEMKGVISNASTNKILVSHAAYGYWEERYKIEQISINGLAPSQEPSQKQLTEIIESVKEHSIKYIIFDKNSTSKIANVLKDEIGAEILYLSNLESISEEELESKKDYFSLMRENLETLRQALQK